MAEEATTTEEEAVATTEEETSTEEAPVEVDDLKTWKSNSRKHEGRAKAEKSRADKAEAELKKLRDADKSEHDKAVEAAREEGRTKALSEDDKERRSDRLEGATLRLAAKGVAVGDKTLKFEDPEDAHVFIERAVAKGELELFDDEGKVQTEDLADALADLLRRKPNLASGAGPALEGGSDAGRGAAGKSLDDMSIDDHLKRRQGRD